MRKIDYIRPIIGILSSILLLCSCEISGEDGPSDEKSATKSLCKYWWAADSLDYDGTTIRQQFVFSADSTGSEIITRTKVGEMTTSKEYFFNWYWESDSYRSIGIKYGKNNIIFMDEIFITDNVLTCFMDGSNLTFYGQEAEY